MAKPATYEAIATLKNGRVEWELCLREPADQAACGKTKADYPDIRLEAKNKYDFKFNITDQTGLGIKFSDDPLWIKRGSQPTGPGIDPQIETPSGKGTPTLTFVDKNTEPNVLKPSPVVLKYQLNFVDKDNKKVTAIDPDIRNGGSDFIGDNGAALLAGIALLLLLGAIWLGVTAIRRRAAPSGPAGDTRTSTTGQQSDVNRKAGDEE